jgi:hypothetical protein
VGLLDKDVGSFKALTVAQQLTAGALTLTDNVLSSLSGKVRAALGQALPASHGYMRTTVWKMRSATRPKIESKP